MGSDLAPEIKKGCFPDGAESDPEVEEAGVPDEEAASEVDERRALHLPRVATEQLDRAHFLLEPHRRMRLRLIETANEKCAATNPEVRGKDISLVSHQGNVGFVYWNDVCTMKGRKLSYHAHDYTVKAIANARVKP